MKKRYKVGITSRGLFRNDIVKGKRVGSYGALPSYRRMPSKAEPMLTLYKKKGVIEVQFNWIFTLIVGALILALFSSIIIKQKSSSENTISATLLTNLETILVGAKISTGTINVIDMPKTNIEFSCNQYSQGNAQKQIRDKVIFSPNLLKGKQLITWALEWKVPFKITNFLYVTSPEVRYILIGTDSTFKIINSTIPNEINKED